MNTFNGARKIENLSKINAWYVEMDGEKPEQLLRIKNSPIYPSRVVESKNGYHVYFKAIDASKENYAEIQAGLIFHYSGDKRAKDLARVLREPGFFHWKDANDPFKVKEIFSADIAYRDKDMLHFFPEPKRDDSSGEEKVQRKPIEYTGNNLTEFLDGLDNEDALSRLSGTSWVNFEKYEFRPSSGNKKNIIVNGKSTSCFIDANKRIGATPGGPNVHQWLRYFGHSDKQIYGILSEIYPGLRI